MAHYLLVNSRDLQEYAGSGYILKLAAALRKRGNDVTLYLVENGVLAARKGAVANGGLTDLSRQGVKILAEDLSLKTRGVQKLADGVAESTMDALADLVAGGADKVTWY